MIKTESYAHHRINFDSLFSFDPLKNMLSDLYEQVDLNRNAIDKLKSD